MSFAIMETTKTAVKERPIIFGAESVKAILEGRKTQTRRVVSLLPNWKAHGLTHADLTASGFWNCWRGGQGQQKPGEPTHQWQYGDEKLRENFQADDRLWVRERHGTTACVEGIEPIHRHAGGSS